MKKPSYRRINITLPEPTVAVLEKVAGKGNRSRIIDEAINQYVENLTNKTLEARLKEGAIARARQNLKMAEEWFHLEEEAWEKSGR